MFEPKYVKHDIFTTNNVEMYRKYTEPNGVIDFLEKNEQKSNIFDNAENLTTLDLTNLKSTILPNIDNLKLINPSLADLLENNFQKNLREMNSTNFYEKETEVSLIDDELDPAKHLEQLLGPTFQQQSSVKQEFKKKDKEKKQNDVIIKKKNFF